MPIPVALLNTAKDLLLFSPLDTDIEAAINTEWDQQVAVLCREYDLFAAAITLTATAGKSIYSVPVGTTRIISVIFRGKTLGYTDRMNLDLRDENWELNLPSTPERWSYNTVPGNNDVPTATITPREFIVNPAPDGAQAGANAFTLITEIIPATLPVWLQPVALYRTVAHVAAENPNCVQPEKGQWFNELAKFWLESSQKLMQV